MNFLYWQLIFTVRIFSLNTLPQYCDNIICLYRIYQHSKFHNNWLTNKGNILFMFYLWWSFGVIYEFGYVLYIKKCLFIIFQINYLKNKKNGLVMTLSDLWWLLMSILQNVHICMNKIYLYISNFISIGWWIWKI